MMLRITTIMLAAAALTLTGCRDREITAYRAPKDPAPAMPMPKAGMANTNDLPPGHPPVGTESAPTGPAAASAPGAMTGTVPTAEGADLLWTAPANWTAKALGSMRKGSYSIAGDAGAVADLAITAFPGDTGGLFANVNRWRGQVGLGPIEAAKLDTATQAIEANGLKMIIVEATGQAGGASTTLLGAIVPHNGQTWFFKLMGPEALVTREKPAFREFLNTIKPR
jgi:hypothetical protein